MDLGRGLFVIKRENMNIQNELDKAWQKAQSFPGELAILGPNDLDPDRAAETFIDLLQQTYVNHGVSQNPALFGSGIRNHQIEPFVVTRDAVPVACAALIKQSDGAKEIGRAVSIENSTGVGKIAMLTAALSTDHSQLVAEIRLADKFAGIPGGEATQRICHGILGLTVHAILAPFQHGSHPSTGAKYNEVFGFASKNVKLIKDSPVQTAKQVIVNRSTTNIPLKGIEIVQTNPFRVGVVSDMGMNLTDFQQESRLGKPGCTLVSIEANDQSMSTIDWLMTHDFILSGIDRLPGNNGLPILFLSTLAHGSLLAPTRPSDTLPKNLRSDIRDISIQLNQLLERS